MPCCAAVECTNSNKKGFLMKHFPKDAAKRKILAGKNKEE